VCLKHLRSTCEVLQTEIGSYSCESPAKIVKSQEWEFDVESKAVERGEFDLRAPTAVVKSNMR